MEIIKTICKQNYNIKHTHTHTQQRSGGEEKLLCCGYGGSDSPACIVDNPHRICVSTDTEMSHLLHLRSICMLCSSEAAALPS